MPGSIYSMYSAMQRIRAQTAFPDSPEQRLAFELSGGAEEVAAVAVRHAGWQGKVLRPLTLSAALWAAMVYGWPAGLAALAAIAIGYTIFSLAQESSRRQLKAAIDAAKAFDAADAVSRFLTAILRISLRIALKFSVFHAYCLVTRSRAATLLALQRLFAGLAGLVHLALSKRLLPAPVASR